MPRRSEHPTRHRPGFIAGAALVTALVVAGIVVSLGALLGGRSGADGGRDGNGAPRAVASAMAGGSVCGLTGMGSPGATLTEAPVTRWATVGTMAAPSSPTAGPGRKQSDGLRSCYAHTVTGALFAVADFWATGSDPRLYRQIVQQNVAAGPGQAKALSASGAPSNTGMSAQITAFKISSYRPAAATVDVALHTSDGQQVGFPVPLVWQDGDWKVQLADDGTPVFRPTILQTLTGYIPWAGTE